MEDGLYGLSCLHVADQTILPLYLAPVSQCGVGLECISLFPKLLREFEWYATLGTTCGRCRYGLIIPVDLPMWPFVGHQNKKTIAKSPLTNKVQSVYFGVQYMLFFSESYRIWTRGRMPGRLDGNVGMIPGCFARENSAMSTSSASTGCYRVI